MSQYQLAQLNIGIAKGPIDSPVMADFVANLDRINALAESSPGFVWRLKDDAGNATDLRPYDPDTLVNMSVWQDVDALRHYVYHTAHTEIMSRRREFFERMPESYLVLWWVEAGHIPTTEEAKERLDCLRRHGPTAFAFTFKQAWPAPDARGESFTVFEDTCPAG
ncbi:DUF3291 domain-containing protein [Silvimonas iriomotensis]|uniref:DUF3291 domain-containing protein n=1 Tax=Silvimonas iriomotensis TaxID=449662 RepID=A0ABQ2P972_9NEIS|nr:DUF3291 domain-containing protein [Silvimonas iriomotensis]GGP21234.1 hypothetical protein GCM10010970_19480 [Silvimonas iriomotensis]